MKPMVPPNAGEAVVRAVRAGRRYLRECKYLESAETELASVEKAEQEFRVAVNRAIDLIVVRIRG